MTANEFAQQIATDLFTNGTGKRAQRLVLELQPTQPDIPVLAAGASHYGGGLVYDAVVSRIEKHLEQNMFWSLSL